MIDLTCGLVGIALIALVLQDAFEVMLLPRRVERRLRFTGLYFEYAWAGWVRLANGFPGRRERLLSVFGALSIVLLFALWAGMLILGFGLLEFAVQPAEGATGLGTQIYMSGVTLFTLGYGDVVPHGLVQKFVTVSEAGGGLGFIAIVISYLPVLYQFFSRREAHVIQLDARAGSPPSAAMMLRRHAEPGGLTMLNALLGEWEVWGAELLESHLSYPMLVYYRSQHDNQSWLAALAAVMDTCALILVGMEDIEPLQARMTFAMARQVLVEMARSFDVAPSPFTGGDRLDPPHFARLVAFLGESGLTWSRADNTEAILAALRATYEPLLDGLAQRLLLRLPDWMPAEDATDHWQRGHRGLIASQLIEELSARSAASLPVQRDRRWRRGSERSD